MPYQGEIKYGREIGQTKGHNPGKKYIWRICISCQEGSWQYLVNGKPQRERCHKCYEKEHTILKMDAHGSWKGGLLTREGYILAKVSDDSPYRQMADSKGYIKQHRLVMAQN